MQVISIPAAKEVITHVAVRHREPVMFWGKPGVGKSEGVKQAAAEHSAELCDIRLSQYDSVDLRGIPVPVGAMTVWNAPITIPFQNSQNPVFKAAEAEDRPIFLFLDEINAAAPSVAAVAYQLINDRAIGEHKLMENVRMMCAGNREQDRGVTNRMPTPLANRLTHYEIDVDVDAWCFHAQQSGWVPEGVAFMQFRKPLLCTFDPSKPDKAFATPRTWEKALRYYADPSMPDDTKMSSMAGSVGEGPAAEFWGFVDVWGKMPAMKDIIANPTTVPVPDEAAMRYAVSVAVSGTMDQKTIPPLAQFMMRMDPEFGVLAWQLAIRRDPTVTGTMEFIDFSKKYRAIFARS